MSLFLPHPCVPATQCGGDFNFQNKNPPMHQGDFYSRV